MKKLILSFFAILSVSFSFAQGEITVHDIMTKPIAVAEWNNNIWEYSESDFNNLNITIKLKRQKIDKTFYASKVKQTFMGYKCALYVQIKDGTLQEYAVNTSGLKPTNSERLISEIISQFQSQGVNMTKGNCEVSATYQFMQKVMSGVSSTPDNYVGYKGSNAYYLFSYKFMGAVYVYIAVKEGARTTIHNQPQISKSEKNASAGSVKR